MGGNARAIWSVFAWLVVFQLSPIIKRKKIIRWLGCNRHLWIITRTHTAEQTRQEREREKKHRSKVGFRSSCYVRVVVGSSTAHVTEYVMEGCSRLPLIIPLITAFCWEPRHYNLTVAHKGKAGTWLEADKLAVVLTKRLCCKLPPVSITKKEQ